MEADSYSDLQAQETVCFYGRVTGFRKESMCLMQSDWFQKGKLCLMQWLVSERKAVFNAEWLVLGREAVFNAVTGFRKGSCV